MIADWPSVDDNKISRYQSQLTVVEPYRFVSGAIYISANLAVQIAIPFAPFHYIDQF